MSENKNILKIKIWKWTDEITQLYLIQPSHAITSKQKRMWKLRKMKMRSWNNKNLSTAAPSRDKLKWAKKKTVRVNLFNTHRKCEVCETERWRKTAYAFVEIHMNFSSSFCRLYWKKEMLYTSPERTTFSSLKNELSALPENCLAVGHGIQYNKERSPL